MIKWFIRICALIGFVAGTVMWAPVFWSHTANLWGFPVNFGWFGIAIFLYFLSKIKLAK